MKSIPPKQYSGKIPEGYSIKDFVRFDISNDKGYGVLYSGDKVDVGVIGFDGEIMATASEAAKLEGFSSLTELALFCGRSTQTLKADYKHNQRMWKAKVKEGMRRRDREEQLKGNT